MSVFENRSGLTPRRLPRLIAGGGVMLLLSGCFLFVTPDRPAQSIPEAASDDAHYYRLHENDAFSCMRLYLPEASFNRPVPAILIFPGGAYGVLSIEKEGYLPAEFLKRQGIAGIVVKYPLGSIFGHFSRHPEMINAAQRAIRQIRCNAHALGIDPEKIGVMGFSAGGHLAGLTAVWNSAAVPDSPDPVERVSARPDFAILCYPVVTMTDPCTHRSSRNNLLGFSPEDELVDKLSLEKKITQECPPVFIWHTLGDTTVDPQNSRMLAEALKRNQVPHRALFYPNGPHGMGLLSPDEARKYPETAGWPEAMLGFLRDHKILTQTSEKER